VQLPASWRYYDQLKPIEQDRASRPSPLEQFKKLVKEYPDSRYRH